MSTFSSKGLDEIISDMDKMGASVSFLHDIMLVDGADIIKESWKQEAGKRTMFITHEMINSINYKIKKKEPNSLKVDIVPMGRDKKGVRNAEKAFILHYGTSPRRRPTSKPKKNKKYPGPGIPPTHWVDDAEGKAVPLVEKKLLARYDDWLAKNGFK